MDIDAALTFLGFVEERHRIWEKRQAGAPQPWTRDPILAARKFTNVFRVLDPGSQFVLTDLLDPEMPPEEFLLQCFLYRHTGRVEAWEYLPFVLGRYPLHEDLDDALEAFQMYRGEVTTKTLQERSHADTPHKITRTKKTSARPVFTGAYLVFPQSAEKGTDKLESIVRLTQRLWDNGSFREFVDAETQRERFRALRWNKGVADFMSMQVLTDFGYSTEFREDEYVVPGPGARKGAAALGMTGEEAIEWAYQAVRQSPDCPTIEGRKPSKMDIQNCLCEYSKYVRYAAKPGNPAPYRPAHPGPQALPVLPERW